MQHRNTHPHRWQQARYPTRGPAWLGLWMQRWMLLALLVLGVLGAVVQASPLGPLVARPLVSVDVQHHPSGPTTVKTFRRDNSTPPYRYEYQRVRAGALIANRMRLLRGPSGLWMVQQYDGDLRPLRNARQSGNALPWEATASDGKCRWNLAVTQEYGLELPRMNLPVETEPALDLTLELASRCKAAAPKAAAKSARR